MAILIDTNILLRSLQPHHPHCAIVERAITALRTGGETLNVAAQNLIEFWAVATRPASENGLGMTIEMATNELTVLKRLFSLLPETASVFEEWERLVTTHRVSGKNTHDARIVAAMSVHGSADSLLASPRPSLNATDIPQGHRTERRIHTASMLKCSIYAPPAYTTEGST